MQERVCAEVGCLVAHHVCVHRERQEWAQRKGRSVSFMATIPSAPMRWCLARRTDVSRRGFLGGAGLAAMSAAVGGPVVFAASMPAGLVPAALAQEAKTDAPATAPAPRRSQRLDFPGKDGGLIVLSDKPLVAETPERLLDDDTTPTSRFYICSNGQIPDPVDRARCLEAHHRWRGQPAPRDHAGRSQEALPAQDLSHGAGERRQRPILFRAGGAGAPMDQRRRGLRRVDRECRWPMC